MYKVRVSMITLILVVAFSTSTSVAFSVTDTDVEVGKETGCNLNPAFVGEETFYEITGEVILNRRIIGLGMQADYGSILRVEVVPEKSTSVVIRGNMWEYALVVLPIDAVEFNVKVWYRPLRAGNMLLRVCKSGSDFYRASVWIKNVPVTHTKYDVNWDGELDRADIEAVQYYLKHPDQRDIEYYRCDVGGVKNVVDTTDLDLVTANVSSMAPRKHCEHSSISTWGKIKGHR